MKNRLGWMTLALFLWVGAAVQSAAQGAPDDAVFVQIEAHPSLVVAQERARLYAAELEDVNGFSLGGSWYGLALGPYAREDAERLLRIYRAGRRIPADSFIADAQAYSVQIWPPGADVLNRGTVNAPPATAATEAPAPDPAPVDETPAEARRSESLLTAEERRELQRALQWAGFYDAGIDGAFGPGTRRAMADWQLSRGHEPSGVLTTRQRAELLADYNAPLTSVGMGPVRDIRAGIAMELPLGEVEFVRYQSPFVHFDPSGDLDARVLLISQPGDQDTLFGLYEIMQTLEIVPLDGPRERDGDGFTLQGRDGRIVSFTEARLAEGEIKGFTLVWPAGDEERRTRVLAAMRESFERLPGVLDPATGADAPQDVDLVSGLEVRRPRLSRSGFYVDEGGAVVTTVEAVEGCTRITLDEAHEARVVAEDPALGVALLRPVERLAPMSVAAFSPADPRLKSEVAVAGYSFEGLLGAPTLTFGTLEDIRGLGGEDALRRLALAAEPGDAGGPVMDPGGGVLGMLLPAEDGARQLPPEVAFAVSAPAIRALLAGAGLRPATRATSAAMAPEDLTRLGSGMTVLVSCWD